MGRKPSSAKRRRPTQGRAKVTVDAILVAAERVLIREGYKGATTNKIAAEAGASTGSLYQYFANRDEIIAAMIDRHCETMLAVLAESIHDPTGDRGDKLVRAVIRGLWTAYQVSPDLFCTVREQIARIARFKQLDTFLDSARSVVAKFLEANSERLRLKSKDPELAAFLIVHAVDGVFVAALRSPAMARDPELFSQEVSAMVLGYLGG